MIDHFGINRSDLQTSAAFYDEVLGTLGHRRLPDFEQASRRSATPAQLSAS